MQPGTKNLARLAGSVALGVLACAGLIGGALSTQAGVSTSIVVGATDPQSKIDRHILEDTANGQSTSFVVLLADQADVSSARLMKDQDARGWYVYNTLSQHAVKSQAALKAALDAAHAPYQSFWVANMIVVKRGDASLVQSLAARSDVRVLESNRSFKGIDDPVTVPQGEADAPGIIPATTEWGVNNVNAPQVWTAGYTGQGIVIGNQDTGMRWTHNALKPKYRGWNGTIADHNYNWHDAIHTGGGTCGPNSAAPCDDNGHGTHTTGTTAGDDGTGNQVGVAPGARWIGCRNMDQGNGTPATYTECFQFFIAPTDLTGQNPNPALRPHVMNNSWGCPTSEGCAATTLQTIVESTRAAGIFVEASAGNAGPGCSTVADPPAIYAASFSTGAIDIGNNLAGFSSRGPVTVDGSNRRKPDISAPGSNVRSSIRTSDSSYGNLSGTSMAGPHVVGVVALLWSARPALVRDIDATEALLEQTANPNVNLTLQTCGGIPSSQIPNNSFGYGRVDAFAAYNGSGGTPTATATGTPPTATRTSTATNTPTITPTVCGGTAPYTIATATGATVVPAGTFITGSNCDDCSSTIALPFPFRLYDQTFNNVNAISNGNLQFVTSDTTFTNTCLPWIGVTYIILPHWDDLLLTGTNQGIYTSVSGTVPNRIFNIEWIGGYFSGGGSVDFEVRLYENSPTGRFDVIYGTVTQNGSGATVGVQKDSTNYTQYSCTGGLSAGLMLTFQQPPCATGTPATATRTNTPAAPTNTTVPPTSTTVAPTATRTNTITPVVGATNTIAPPTSTGGVPTNTTAPATSTRTNTISAPTSTAQTAVPNNTNTPGQPTATPTHCAINFADVLPSNTFYANIRCLACRGIINGYPCGGTGEPCNGNNDPYFRPGNNLTRGQLAKIVAQSAGLNGAVSGQSFEDVLPGTAFYTYTERLFAIGAIGGYTCGIDPNEPCNPPGNKPYYRPGASVTRGQLTKIVSIAAGFTDPAPLTFTFTDVPVGSTFHIYVERLLTNRPGVMSGYPCGGVNPQSGQPEPCDSQNRAYFRVNNNLSRGQASKIVGNTFFPGCVTPSR